MINPLVFAATFTRARRQSSTATWRPTPSSFNTTASSRSDQVTYRTVYRDETLAIIYQDSTLYSCTRCHLQPRKDVQAGTAQHALHRARVRRCVPLTPFPNWFCNAIVVVLIYINPPVIIHMYVWTGFFTVCWLWPWPFGTLHRDDREAEWVACEHTYHGLSLLSSVLLVALRELCYSRPFLELLFHVYLQYCTVVVSFGLVRAFEIMVLSMLLFCGSKSLVL